MIESKASSDITESKKSKALDSDNVWSRKRSEWRFDCPRAITSCSRLIDKKGASPKRR
ncbi:MAG TPA: hypothetical protein IAA33_06055 [Candidatus Helicobacter avicola]|nr:hypothetical protein [Candidatus Helicobacter avicola]